MKINEILTIDLSEDIKNVIDLEDISEQEIQSEIEGYIVTDGLAKEYADFVNIFTSNIMETGVWISGFYGSGKSYFGKLLGYLISNRIILGTPARARILQRFHGVNEEALVRNAINRLDSVNSRVIFLDVAKQDTSKGLSFTLFRNFIKSLELPENEHGVFLFQLMLNDNQIDIHDFIFSNLNKNWSDIRTRLIEYARASKEIYLKKGYTESDYETIITTIRRDIDQFSASRLKDEIKNYLDLSKNENIVFLFDEASEAINQQKFNLLDLEGISESLSSLGGKVWTIAIAQEKLDDVINNSNVSKAQLTKVTDRFKTKIHLEATEVDVIIRERLLKKKDVGIQKLGEHFKLNSGKIADHASIYGAGISKTDTLDSYTTYYPFYKYHFDLLQNFLFGTKGYASTKVAARGMIITTYDILKQEVQHSDLFNTVTGWQIAKEGQPQPSARLVSRYDNAERILHQEGLTISGRKLLETINFLNEAEVTPSSLPNIVRSYISNPDTYHATQDSIEKSLVILTEAKVLLDTNKTYRITSDIEQRLLDEMKGYSVQGFIKKKQLVGAYKASNIVRSINKITEAGTSFDFYITTDNDDELNTTAQKSLKIKVKSIYNITENRNADIDALRTQHQNDKDLIWLVPDNSNFKELDLLIDDVERISYLEQKYNNPQSEEGKILVSFSTSKSEKQSRIKDLVEESLVGASSIYLFNNLQLDKDNWQSILQSQQKQLIQNVYHKRLASQLTEQVAVAVIREANNARLQQFFVGNDFAFFDNQGNFIGDNLKVCEEILHKTRNAFVDGSTLEKDLKEPPAGYSYGTVISTVAALMRAGKLIAKNNGAEKFSWKDDGVIAIFSTSREFGKTSFKAVSKALSATQKQELAQFLLDIDVEKYINKRIDYNTNDFDLVNAVRDTAKYFVDKTGILKSGVSDFNSLFPKAIECTDKLNEFTSAVSEANYIDKAMDFLLKKDDFLSSIEDIGRFEKFIQINLPKLKEWKTFVKAVEDELQKAATQNLAIQQLSEQFDTYYTTGVVKNYGALQSTTQKIQDEYFKILSESMMNCSANYKEILQSLENLTTEIAKLPSGLNDENLEKIKVLKQYAEQRVHPTVKIDFDVKDKQSRFTYSEVLSFIDLYRSKKNDVEVIKSSLVRDKAPDKVPGTGGTPTPVLYSVSLPSTKIKVKEYKEWLKAELQKIASASDNDEIEIN
ncbi:MAG: BREX system P-loop protein BrxC [Rickettsiaceae bacterium]|nr:BREX system P-loop protein BrxC [Rickettsiaceae bacterium]